MDKESDMRRLGGKGEIVMSEEVIFNNFTFQSFHGIYFSSVLCVFSRVKVAFL